MIAQNFILFISFFIFFDSLAMSRSRVRVAQSIVNLMASRKFFTLRKVKNAENVLQQIPTEISNPPEIVDLNTHIPTKKHSKLKGFSAIVGDISQEIKECTEFLKKSTKFDRMGATLPKGLLMVGPPGTGKTALARSISEESGLGYHYSSATEFNNQYYGVAEENIRQAFSTARALASNSSSKKALLFIDEIDAFGTRNESRGSAKTMINELLTQMDGFERHGTSVFVMGATNCADQLDPALKRPGRFDKIIKINLPDYENRKKIISFYFSFVRHNKESISQQFIEEFATNTDKFSPADLKCLINDAAIIAVRENADAVQKEHVKKAFDIFVERSKNTNYNMNKKE